VRKRQDDLVHDVALLVVLVVAVVAVTRLAVAIRVSAAVLLVLAGLVVAALPGVPAVEIDPNVVLFVLLPPLLFAASLGSSYVALRQVRGAVLVLAVGLVLFTSAAVAFAIMPVLPGISLAAAFAVGAIVAPPDAVAATAVARRTGMPRQTVTILEGESLFDDATALTTLRIAVAVVATGTVTVLEVVADFSIAVVGGVAVGIAGALALGWVRRRGIDTLSGVALSVAAPFAAYFAAEGVDGSGVIAVVVMGLILGHRSSVEQGPEGRITDEAIWKSTQFVLEGAVFALIGLQLPAIIENVEESAGTVLAVCAVTLGAVILARPLWIVAGLLLARAVPWLNLGRPAWSDVAVISWAGMRGVVSLAAAQSLPVDFPNRDLALLVAIVVILGTLGLQGLTLPAVIRLVGVRPPDPRLDALAIANAQEEAVDAAVRRLDELAAEQDLSPDMVVKLRTDAERRGLLAWERLGRVDGGEPPSRVYLRLRNEMLSAEREIFVRMRDSGDLDDDVLRRVQAELDLEQALLVRRAEVERPSEETELPTRELSQPRCRHLRNAPLTVEPRWSTECEDCIAEGRTDWVHLRACLDCGHTGCCDSSPRRHARWHFEQTEHPVMRSAEPGETWRWCYVDRELG
jgi:monovalent cation/hydrogen antiporter